MNIEFDAESGYLTVCVDFSEENNTDGYFFRFDKDGTKAFCKPHASRPFWYRKIETTEK